MTGHRRHRRTLARLALVACFGWTGAAWSAAGDSPGGADPGIATLEATQGPVTVIRLGQAQAAQAPMPLLLDDIVVTKQTRASVVFHSDGSVLRIGPDSRVQINESAKERQVTLFFGRLWAHVVRWKERPTRFTSGSTIAAIRGTELSFALAEGGDQTQLAVIEGKVEAQNDAGSLALGAGQVAVASKGQAPALRAQVKPHDAVQWALYYLPVLYVKPAELGEGAWQARVRESSEAYIKGDLSRATDSLQGVDAGGIQDPRFFTYRASLALAGGKVEEAGKDLDRALQLAPTDSRALAIQAVMAVVNNEADKALAAGQKAVAADKQSSTAQIALSYAQQAKFDIAGARASLESAVRLKPDDALAWARLAEIRSSQGYLDQALEAAKKAAELEPDLARTQTVLGYAYLTQVKTRDAREAFKKAIELDAADPLPRLGLGLAEIRDGRVKQGSREIEVAVSLDPGQALVRSYLGKAYYEAKREALVGREYDVAKTLDPKDPTPFLYDAISKQTTNQPVEALQDVQEAIDLNDNRAVYRSRLLLDSDLAARSASLGRIYADLGFQDLALVEGWTSVSADPSDYSAHRLLADSYAALPRHEIARVSELFQSQMLQPLNTTPIQPSLGESNLFLISTQGPGNLAFNEFNPLFNRNQTNVQGSFVGGEDNTWAGEGIASGIYGKLSFSVGYSSFQTDGFRINDSQDDKIATGFVQVQLDPATSVQAEVRHRKLETGDLRLTFFEDDFNPNEADSTKNTSVRAGVRHDFAPGVTLLASYMHSNQDIGSSVPDPINGNFNLTTHENADSVEGQLLYRSSAFKAIGGGGYFKVRGTDNLDISIPEVFENITVTDTDISHTNLYVYSYLSMLKDRNLTATLGVSGDFFDESGTATQDFGGGPAPTPAPVLGKRDQANPKVGLQWTSKSGTTLRGAVFRALKRTLITDQTLEPTQVAGFNQFYDDLTGTKSWVYGGAIDQKFGRKVFAGAEVSKRDLNMPQTLIENNVDAVTTEYDGSERAARGYLFVTANPRLTFSAEYQYEKLEAAPQFTLPYTTVKTQRVPLSARFFHPKGWSAYFSTTYLNQDGDFLVQGSYPSQFIPGSRSFWVVDAGLRYRLPKRYGFVAFGVNNLTDERTVYVATDSTNPPIRPGRLIFGRVILAFP